MSKCLYVGMPGRVFEIPAPASGMGFTHDVTAFNTRLDGGGRAIDRAPVSLKAFNMSWRDSHPKLQPLIDLYNQRYGRKPFYMHDPTMVKGNMLPPRWAYCWQLPYIMHGQGQPILVPESESTYPTAEFTGNGWFFNRPALKIMLKPGYNYRLKAFGDVPGSAGTGIRVRKHHKDTGWETTPTVVQPSPSQSDAPTVVVTASESQHYDFVELSLNVDSGDVMRLWHMDFSGEDYRSAENPMRPGEGVGALKFTSAVDGELIMRRNMRVGMSADFEEVEQLSV